MRKTILIIALFLATLNVWALKPDRTYPHIPSDFNVSYQAARVRTFDAVSLNAWIYEPVKEKSKGVTIIFSYGDAGNMGYCILSAKALVEEGYRVVCYDYRGFGQSDTFNMDPNRLYYDEFTRDLSSVLIYTRALFPKEKIALMGLSMGTIISTLVAAKDPVDFLIGEGYIKSPTASINFFNSKLKKTLSVPPSASSYEQSLASFKKPLLVVMGTDDIFTTVADGTEIVGTRKERKLITFPGKHLEGFQKMTQDRFGDLFAIAITEFINDAQKAH